MKKRNIIIILSAVLIVSCSTVLIYANSSKNQETVPDFYGESEEVPAELSESSDSAVSGDCIEDSTEYKLSLYDEAEEAVIKKVIAESPMFTGSTILNSRDKENIKNGTFSMYKMYRALIKNPVQSIAGNEDFKAFISDGYLWKAVTPSDASVTVIKEEDEWSVAGCGKPYSTDTVSGNIQMDVVKSALEGMNAEEIFAVEFPQLRTQFVYIKASGSEYLIPFSSRPDFNGLENGKLYTRKQAGDRLLNSSYNSGTPVEKK